MTLCKRSIFEFEIFKKERISKKLHLQTNKKNEADLALSREYWSRVATSRLCMRLPPCGAFSNSKMQCKTAKVLQHIKEHHRIIKTKIWVVYSSLFFPTAWVSGSYLALRGVYLALWAALPSNSTLGESRHNTLAVLWDYHPLWAMAPVKVDLDRPTLGGSPKHHIPRNLDGLDGGSVLDTARFICHCHC